MPGDLLAFQNPVAVQVQCLRIPMKPHGQLLIGRELHLAGNACLPLVGQGHGTEVSIHCLSLPAYTKVLYARRVAHVAARYCPSFDGMAELVGIHAWLCEQADR